MYSTTVLIYTQRQIVVLLDGNSPRKFMPQYAKPLTLHKGVDNRIQFQFLNQQQKPVDITDKEITCRVMNSEGTEVVFAKLLDLDFALTGIASLNLTASQIEDITPQKGYYSLEFPVDDGGYPVFVDYAGAARGDMFIVDSVLPSFVPSIPVTIPTGQNNANLDGSNVVQYYSSVINTRDSSILTIQSRFEEYNGNVVIQGSTIPDGYWYDITIDEDFDNTTDTRGYTIRGFHPYVRVEFNSDNGEVTNILAR